MTGRLSSALELNQPCTGPSRSIAPNGFRAILEGKLVRVHDIGILQERVEIELLKMLVAVEVPKRHIEGAGYLSLPISLCFHMYGPTKARVSFQCRPYGTTSAKD